MSFHVDIDTGVDFVRFIRYLTQNTRGPPSSTTQNWLDVILTRLRFACEDIARRAIQEQHSDGPPLSKKWIHKKDMSWINGTVTPPPYATSPSDVNVWSGFIDQYLTSWVISNGTVNGGNGVKVGYNTNPVHPHSGRSLMRILAGIHFGFQASGKFVQPRPFLNSSWARQQYLQAAMRIVNEALNNILTTGAP